MAVLTRRTPGGSAYRRRPPLALVRAFVALTKPRVIELLLITTLPVMFLAARGLPPLWPVVFTVIGGYLSAGSASALNCYLDRDIDAKMRRTRHRPINVMVSPREALIFGLVLGVLSTLVLGLLVNWLSAGLALAANVFYVVGYTILLKRRTSSNIVWGGIAGCVPALIGWTAVTGSLDWPPFVLFLVVFFWTPAHYWPLAMKFRDDYAAAEVPMLPVVAPELEVARRIVCYCWLTVACSLALWPVAQMGVVYPVGAAILGAVFLLAAHRLLAQARAGTALRPIRVFHMSNSYLALLFVLVAVDPLLV